MVISLNTKKPAWGHQVKAYEYAMTHAGVGLFMGVRSGKTKVTVDTIANKGHKRVLVVTLRTILLDGVWEREVAENSCVPMRVMSLIFKSSSESAKYLREEHRSYRSEPLVVVTNYESVWRDDLKAAILSIPWDAVVLDEGHRIASAGATVSKFLHHLGTKVKHRFILTGSPIRNTPVDVYSLFKFLNPGIFGTRKERFEERYCIFGGYNKQRPIGYRHLDEIHQLVHANSFTVKTEDVLDLPPEMDTTVRVYLEPEVSKFYEELRREMVATMRHDEQTNTLTLDNALVKMTRLQQICGGWLTDDAGLHTNVSKAKLQALMEQFEMLESEGGFPPVVVFCRFTREIEQIRKAASSMGIKTAELSGKTNQLQYWKDGEADALIVQIRAGSAGIDLTRAATGFYFSKSFSLEEYVQSRGRLTGVNQKSPHINYVHLNCAMTIDYLIDEALVGKQDVVNYLIRSHIKE